MAGGGKCEVNALLKMVIGITDKSLELTSAGDNGTRSGGFGGLAKGMGVDEVLDFIDF